MSKVHFPTLLKSVCTAFADIVAVEKLLLFYLHLEIYSYQNYNLLRKTVYTMQCNVRTLALPSTDLWQNPTKKFYSTMTLARLVSANEFGMEILFKFNCFRHATYILAFRITAHGISRKFLNSALSSTEISSLFTFFR